MRERAHTEIERGGIEYLNLITDVNDEGIRNRLYCDPCVALANLEALDTVIGEQYCKPSGIRVGGEAKSEVGLRALGVVVHPHASTDIIAAECLLQESHIQPQAY